MPTKIGRASMAQAPCWCGSHKWAVRRGVSTDSERILGYYRFIGRSSPSATWVRLHLHDQEGPPQDARSAKGGQRGRSSRSGPPAALGTALNERSSRLRLPVEQLLGSKEVDPAVDEVEQFAHRALLLDLLLEEPLKERKAAVIRAILGRAGERVELARDADLALESGLHCRPRRGVLGDPRSNGRQVERDFVVDEERDDLRRVLRFLDRLAMEEASPLLEALPLEVQGNPVVRLVGAEFVTDLLDEQVGHELSAHPVSYTHLRAHETRHDLVCRL